MFAFIAFLLHECLAPFGFLLFMCYIYVKYSNINKLVTRDSSIKSRQNVLLVTAHPDDECMFFAPTILSMINAGHNIYLVCLSKGDYYGQGEIRKKELIASCSKLGLPVSNVTIVDDERFKDGPKYVWDTDSLGERILGVIQRTNADSVITFDGHGVSGHPNHRALYSALQKLKRGGKMDSVTVFALTTTGLIRKYLSWFDIPASSITCLTTFVSSPREVVIGWKAMMMHQTQLKWFRWLYIGFSRYMYVNTLVELD